MWTDEFLIPMMLNMSAVREIFIVFRCRLVVRKLTKVYGNIVIANVSRNKENQ